MSPHPGHRSTLVPDRRRRRTGGTCRGGHAHHSSVFAGPRSIGRPAPQRKRTAAGKVGEAVATLIGKVSHYFGKIGVAGLDLEGQLKVGDTIRVSGATTDLVQQVSSMQIEHEAVESAVPGDNVATKLTERVRVGDEVYLEDDKAD